MNHHKVQSILAAAPCRAGDVISIDQTGWGVTSGHHWYYHDGFETPYDDLFLMPQEQRHIANEDGDNVSQLYIGWEMPNGIKVGRNGGQNGNWWLSRRRSELGDRWYTMNKSYQDALDYADGTAYAGQGAGVNLTNYTALSFTANTPVGVALHDVWPHETGHPFAVNMFRSVFRMRVKHLTSNPIRMGDLISTVPYQQYGQKSASDVLTDTNAVGYAITEDYPFATDYPLIDVVAHQNMHRPPPTPPDVVTITSQPGDYNFKNTHGIATFAVSATSAQGNTLSYQWQRRNPNELKPRFYNVSPTLDSGVTYTNYTTKTLSITGLTTAHIGYEYRCAVWTNDAPEVRSDWAELIWV